MDQNKKFLVYAAVICSIFLSYYIFQHNLAAKRKKRSQIVSELKFERFEIDKPGMLLDVNTATKESLLRRGVSLKISEKILEYRDIVGYVAEISELKRISGIGKKTMERLTKILKTEGIGKKKSFNINMASEKILKYYGFTKNEIRRIEDWKKENREIYSNIELRDILGSERYDEYKNLVSYGDYD